MITVSKENVVASLRPAVLLDRDGTITRDPGYLSDPGGISFFPGVPEAMKKLQERGYLLVVATNQSGIGRGYFSEEAAIAVNLAMLLMLRDKGVGLAAVYYCPHDPGEGCRCRKPGTLMVERAVLDLGIDAGRSWMIGDMGKDVLCGMEAGLKPILVETGSAEKGLVPDGAIRCSGLVQAADLILEGGSL